MSDQQIAHKIVLRRAADLKARKGNPRTHDRKQLRAISASIRRFGFNSPILVDGHDTIIAGHARWAAAMELGLTEVPTISLLHLTKTELNAYVIADNRTADLGGWDKELLAISIESISDLDPDFDISITGFSLEDIELIGAAKITKAAKKATDVAVPPVEDVVVARPGDLWRVGSRHLVWCGDATLKQSYAALLGSDRADQIVTDPPYGCKISGHVSGLGAITHREFVMGSGEMTEGAFNRFLSAAMGEMVAWSRPGSVHYIFSDWRIIRDILDIGHGFYEELLNIAVWNKSNAGMGSFLRSQHELIAIFRKGRRRHINNIALGANGRHRSNVWTYPGANSFGATRDRDLADHPTVKNTAMIVEAILDTSHRDDIVLDVFGGSGTTLLACETAQRRARLMELDPRYVDVILRRAMSAGMEACLADTSQPFEEVCAARTGGGL